MSKFETRLVERSSDRASRRGVHRAFACAMAGAALAIGLAAGAHGEEAKPLKVGLFYDFTGAAATLAEPAKIAIDMAVSEINAKGGIAGRKIETVVADTQTDPTIGVGEIKRLVQQEKVDVVLGPVISQVLLAALPVLNEAKILSISATGTDLTTPQAAPYNFSIMVSAQTQAIVMAEDAAKRLHAKSAAILSDSGAQAKSFVPAVKAELEKRGVKVSGTQEFQYQATDMTPQLLALRRGNPDVLILLASTGPDVGNTMKGITELGWKVKVSGTYSMGGFAAGAIRIAGADAFKNASGINYKAFTYCSGEGNPKAFADFVQKMHKFNPERAGRVSLPVAGFIYDTVYLLKDAIEGTGGKTDGPTLAAWIEKNAHSYSGINVKFAASPQTHFLIGPDNLATVQPEQLRDGVFQLRLNCP
jgi:ABC-type branched-subunit amino acid transport system substrate-binding protein